MVHGALVIAGKDLRQRLRDRSAIVLGFVAPLAIAALMSFAFQGTATFHVTIAVVDDDHGALATAFTSLLDSPALHDLVGTKGAPDEQAASNAVRNGDAQVAVVIPSRFTAAATTTGTPLPLTVLTSADHRLAGDVARSITESFLAQVNADRLSVATALAAGAPVGSVDALVERATALTLPVQTTQQPTGARTLKPISYFGPAMGMFFLFFAIAFGARGYFIEQREGTLERMAAAVHPGAVLVGKALSVFVYGTLSLATMAVFTTAAFGADWGGPLPAAALCLSMVVAVVALTMLVTVVARTERQAEGFSSIVVFTLALLGGNFVFVSAAPSLLRRLALFTPNGWALRGFVDLATTSHSLGTVAQPVAAILTFAAVVLAVTSVLSRRLVLQ